MNLAFSILLCCDIVRIIVWHKCDSYNMEPFWIVTLQGNVDFLPMEWKKSLKIGGNVLQLVVNAMEKEKLLNVWVMIGLQKKLSTLLIFCKKTSEKWRGGVLWFKAIFCHLKVEILSSNFPHISMDWKWLPTSFGMTLLDIFWLAKLAFCLQGQNRDRP